MSSPTRPLLAVLALGGAALAVPAVRAQTATLQYQNVLPFVGVSGHAGTGTFSDYAAGVYQLQVQATTGGLVLPDPLYLFCVELQETAPISPAVYDVLPAPLAAALSGPPDVLAANIPDSGVGLERARNLQLLYGQVFGGAYTPLSTLATDAARSAFQLAVWELSHDDDFNLSAAAADPHFWVTSAATGVIAQAQTWVDAVAAKVNASDFSGQMLLVALHHDDLQDYLVPLGNGVVVPEPGAVALWLGAGAAGVVLLRRRLRFVNLGAAR